MKQIISVLFLIILVISIAWGCTILGKWCSYKFFYEAQVKETIYQVLREERIK